MRKIGLIGKIGSGKDTAAQVLINTFGYVPVAFASPLKEMVIEADPVVHYRTKLDGVCPVHLSDLLDDGRSFEECKREYHEVRRSLQRIGQGARKIDPDYWVRLAEQTISTIEYYQNPIVVTDVRYVNEADMLVRRGFTLVRITRKHPAGMTMEDTRAALHDSETSLDGYVADYTITNDSTPEHLAAAVLELVQ